MWLSWLFIVQEANVSSPAAFTQPVMCFDKLLRSHIISHPHWKHSSTLREATGLRGRHCNNSYVSDDATVVGRSQGRGGGEAKYSEGPTCDIQELIWPNTIETKEMIVKKEDK